MAGITASRFPPCAAKPVIEVACAVVLNSKGEALLAQRPEGKLAAGWWEFPGGKIEQGESALRALERELREELDVEIITASPLMRFRHEYSDRIVVLDSWRVTAFGGDLRACEGQGLRWVPIDDFDGLQPLLPTVRPMQTALRIPADYVFTPPNLQADRLLAGMQNLPTGCWLRLRLPSLDVGTYRRWARMAIEAGRGRGISVVLDRDHETAIALGAAGWHADSATLMRLDARPPGLPLVIGSVHDAGELAQACALGFDAAVLGPVLPTPSHAGAENLGWKGFRALRAEWPLPVLALGGLAPHDLAQAREANAQGIAGISAYWR